VCVSAMVKPALGTRWVERLSPGSERSHRQCDMGWGRAGETHFLNLNLHMKEHTTQ